MSATNRGRVKLDDDAYETPPWAVERLLEKADLPGGLWFEPCAGHGNIITAVRAARKDVTWAATEVREECLPRLKELGFDNGSIRDFLAFKWPLSPYDLTLSNPPFSFAQEFLEKALSMSQHVAFLLRLNYLGSEKRQTFLKYNMPDVYVLPNRPSFAFGGTDATEYAWLVFHAHGQERGIVTVLNSTPLEVRRPKKT